VVASRPSRTVSATTGAVVDQGDVVRRLYKMADLLKMGYSRSSIRTAVRNGRLRKVENGVYARGSDDPSEWDRAVAAVLVTGWVASGAMAGVLLGLDGVEFTRLDITVTPSQSNRRPGIHRRDLPAEHVTEIDGIRCTDGVQTLVDLAPNLDDARWEQALESALHRRLTTLADVVRGASGSQRGAARMRRVLTLRPLVARPTESLLETLMVQLIRGIPTLPSPIRQLDVVDAYGEFVARVDLAWPSLGLFIELDGQHHRGQPVYDARRETAIVAATGWLCGRFTWREVFRHPGVTARRLKALADQARRRPLP
jgi:hypothetical protein